MTCVMVWRNREANHDEFWAVGDTRISGGNSVVLTNEGPKIFSLPIRCYKPGTSGFFDTLCYEGSIGCAFAGSTLIANSTVLAVMPLLARLSTMNDLPTVEQITSFVGSFLERYTRAVNWVTSTRAEIAIFGRNPSDGKLDAFKLRPETITGTFRLILERFDSTPNDAVLFLGQHEEEISDLLQQSRSVNVPYELRWWRTPLYVLRAVIAQNRFDSIGGGEQLGITQSKNFDIYSPVRPFRVGDSVGTPLATSTWLGVDMPRINTIGPCFIGLPGMT